LVLGYVEFLILIICERNNVKVYYCEKIQRILNQKHLHGKKWFVTATKLGTTNKFFVAATKNFAAATKRFVDRTKHFVVVTKCFC